MSDITVSVFAASGRQLLALIPVPSMPIAHPHGAPCGDDDLVTYAMGILRDGRGFSDLEVRSFRYEVRRVRPIEADGFSIEVPVETRVDKLTDVKTDPHLLLERLRPGGGQERKPGSP